MKRILVGIDGSDGSKLALEKAISMISEGGRIVLIAVVPSADEKAFFHTNFYKKIKKNANQLIDDIKNEIRVKNYNIKGIVEDGDAAEKIIDIAAKLDVDLIVLGSKGTNKIGIYPIGSVTNKVVQYSHKPVMVVR
jgi:nucleotide-binding universal stress UspA family protein